MTTPRYVGGNQFLPETTGLLARLGSYFGTGTPAYAAPPSSDVDDAQAVREAQGRTCICTCVPATTVPLATECPLDPQELASGQIAIVIPRPAT